MTISLINKEQVVNSVKHRYGIYLLLHCSKNKNYAVISRSGIFKKAEAKSSLLSGKIYSDREEAVQRYETLLSSAHRRNFQRMSFHYGCFPGRLLSAAFCGLSCFFSRVFKNSRRFPKILKMRVFLREAAVS